MEWYVVYVKANMEEEVQNLLNNRFKESFYSLIPKRRLIVKRQGKLYHFLEKLFPGYVFIKTDMDRDKHKAINRTSGVVQLVSANTDFVKVDDNEMAMILKLVNNEGIIEYSKLLKENSKITVLEGPLLGLESIIKKVNSHTNRAKILINLMGNPKMLDVGLAVQYPPKSMNYSGNQI